MANSKSADTRTNGNQNIGRNKSRSGDVFDGEGKPLPFARAAASLLADHYDEDWTALWWIRLDGVGRVLADGPEHERAIAMLCGKYEQYRHQRPTGPVIAIDVARWSAWP